MTQRVLITGGAGFIGSHVSDELIRHGHQVRVLDSLAPQVHANAKRPAYLDPEIELRVGDVRDENAVASALHDIDAVIPADERAEFMAGYKAAAGFAIEKLNAAAPTIAPEAKVKA